MNTFFSFTFNRVVYFFTATVFNYTSGINQSASSTPADVSLMDMDEGSLINTRLIHTHTFTRAYMIPEPDDSVSGEVDEGVKLPELKCVVVVVEADKRNVDVDKGS